MSSGTARLKRRLDEQGINYTNKRAVENFCLIGTPLPPLEKKDANEFVPLWKQDVRDEKGRRRLHGAFTGGFSAGYFNTVGSKEGWTPSTFVSSRSDRAKQKSARPEDYMDEEDLAELRESQIMSGVKDQQQRDVFAGTAQAEPPQQGDPEQEWVPFLPPIPLPIAHCPFPSSKMTQSPKPPLGAHESIGDRLTSSIAASIRHALMPPLEDSPGVRLLKKMGWRAGQGVGPRVSWRMRKIQDLLAAGKSINGVDVDALDGEDEDEEAKRHMYPPRDTVVPRVPMKTDVHGLGFKAGAGLMESIGEKRPRASGPKLAAGFGLGALNEAEDDDVDIYESTSRADRTYMPYDAIRDANEGPGVSQRKATQKPTTTQQRFPNGILVLAGFILSPDTVQKEQWFPIPEIVKGWKPDPRRVWQIDPSRDGAAASAAARENMSWKKKLTADQRGAILGETPLPSTRSVFDYLSKEDRERIEHAAAGLQPPTSEPTPAPVEDRPASSGIPYIAPHIASAALKGFMPFTNDPAKQARYIAYLRSQATPEYPELVPPKLPDQTTEVYHKELSDYSKSAAIFKPVSGAMASRFTTAAVVDSGPNAIEGLHQPTHQEESGPASQQEEKERDKEVQRPSEEAQSSKAHAARTGMYGTLTREIVPWQPSRLLCKRFGVKDPNADVTTDTPMPGVPSAGGNNNNGAWKAEDALAEADLQTATGGSASDAAGAGPSSGRRMARDLENVGLGEDETQGRDTLTYVRPSMDIFKAIFASDDEDSDDEEAVEEDGGSQEKKGDATTSTTLPQQLEEKPTKNADTDAKAVPTPHLRAHDAVEQQQQQVSYEPRSSERSRAEPVDMTTFKPVFVPRAERETQTRGDKRDGRGKDSKKRAKAIVSFEDDGDDEGAALVIAPHLAVVAADKDKDKARKKKKRRKEKEEGEEKEKGRAEGGEEDVGMWVEKEPPQVVANFASTAATTAPPQPPPRQPLAKEETRIEPPVVPSMSSNAEGPPRGRKRAIDFL